MLFEYILNYTDFTNWRRNFTGFKARQLFACYIYFEFCGFLKFWILQILQICRGKFFEPSLPTLNITYFTNTIVEFFLMFNKFYNFFMNIICGIFFSHRSKLCILQIIQIYWIKYMICKFQLVEINHLQAFPCSLNPLSLLNNLYGSTAATDTHFFFSWAYWLNLLSYQNCTTVI